MSSITDKWLACWVTDQDIHVVPIEDALEHEDEDCACLPRAEAVNNPDGSFAAFLTTHNAWDGRE